MTSHTPGPYFVERRERPNLRGDTMPCFRILADKGSPDELTIIADTPTATAEARANAQLFAAAPDMLDAIQAVFRLNWPGLSVPQQNALAGLRLASLRAKEVRS